MNSEPHPDDKLARMLRDLKDEVKRLTVARTADVARIQQLEDRVSELEQA